MEPLQILQPLRQAEDAGLEFRRSEKPRDRHVRDPRSVEQVKCVRHRVPALPLADPLVLLWLLTAYLPEPR